MSGSDGLGTIVEYNRLLNCEYAFALPNGSNTSDIVFDKTSCEISNGAFGSA